MAQACEPGDRFPLRVADGDRHLVDGAGEPFLLHGDTAWSLIAELTREEANQYLRDRQKRGFNTILVNLIESRFSSKAPANIYGVHPFQDPGDYASPNETYFDHAEWVLRRACDLGIAVLLTPSYAGNGGGGEGWYRAMVAAGPDDMLEYGRYVGRKLGHLPNLVWVHGGDYNPPDKDLVRAMARGIRETDPDALHTAHGSPGWAALEYWRGEPWLAVDNVYTYEPVHDASLGQHRDGDGMPFFLMESAYENEHGAGEHRVRVQAYQALLTGASGHLYGNNPMWHFSGPGLHEAPGSWQEQLGSRGAESMSVLYEIMSSTRWWLLEPDVEGAMLVAGAGLHDDRAVAARAADGSFGLVYMPSGRVMTVDLGTLAGPTVVARWLDPSTGEVAPVAGSPFSAEGRITFIPKPGNGAGDLDWILELQSRPGEGG